MNDFRLLVAIPSLYNPANYGRYSVCLLSPGVSYPPVFTVVVDGFRHRVLQMAKTACEQFCHVEVISVQYSHKTQQHISIVLIHDHHGGRRPTTAAIVPHSRLRGVETLANRLCNNAT